MEYVAPITIILTCWLAVVRLAIREGHLTRRKAR
jgi:hypothetical protein